LLYLFLDCLQSVHKIIINNDDLINDNAVYALSNLHVCLIKFFELNIFKSPQIYESATPVATGVDLWVS